jgi:hypothetical protein
MQGSKNEKKNRLTLLLCCSCTGEKLRPLVIGKSRAPRAFKNINVESLPCKYYANASAWLTRSIFMEWVTGFNSQMAIADRKICLVLDSLSGHMLGSTFSNVKLIFLPPGMTSVLQLLDCGIIRSLKACYSTALANGRVDSFEAHLSFCPNIKDAIDMIAKAWVEIRLFDATPKRKLVFP